MTFVTEDNITGLAEQRWMTAHSPRLAELMAAPGDGAWPVPYRRVTARPVWVRHGCWD